MDTDTPMAPSSQFHPEFNRRVVEIVFKVDNTCFRLDAALLAGHSTFFSDMLDSPHIGLPGEGTDTNPVVVAGTTESQFLNFCRWITHQAGSKLALEEQNIIDVLHVCSIYGMRHGIEFAKDSLDDPLRMPALSPTRRLFLARRYNISSWVEKAVRQLIRQSAGSYSREDRELLGFDVFVILMVARDKIQETRQRFANYHIEPSAAQSQDAPYCPSHIKCRRIWIEKWFTHLSRRIHDTKDPIALPNVAQALQNMDHPDMNPACKALFISLVQASDHLWIQQRTVESTAAEILQLGRV